MNVDAPFPAARHVGTVPELDSAESTESTETTGGAVWRLSEPTRGLDANIIQLPPDDSIQEHDGPGLDVLIHVLDGDGILSRGNDHPALPLRPGDLVWLPGTARRGYTAGPSGLRYFSVHTRKPGMQIGRRPAT